jgi:hypothetical protein
MISRSQLETSNPTQTINLDFGTYLTQRQQKLSAHLASGVPDYSFSLDRTLQQQIAAIGPIRALTQTIVSFVVSIQKQIQQMQSIIAASISAMRQAQEISKQDSQRIDSTNEGLQEALSLLSDTRIFLKSFKQKLWSN